MVMDCPLDSELVRYACGDLDEAERALAEGHIRDCEGCREELKALRSIVKAASNLGRRKLSGSRRRAVMQAADELLPLEPAKRKEMIEEKERVRTVRLIPVPAMAACAGIVLAIATALAPGAGDVSRHVMSMQERLEELLQEETTLRAGSARELLAWDREAEHDGDERHDA